MSFKDEVLNTALTPSRLGKFFIVMVGFVFTAGVMMTVSERDHADFKRNDAKHDQSISKSVQSLSQIQIQLNTMVSESQLEKEFSEERRRSAAGDRARIQRMLEQLLQREP